MGKNNIFDLNINGKILSNVNNGVIVLDNNLKIYLYNKWLEIYTKHKESDVIGKYIHKIFTNIDSLTLSRKVNTAIKINTPTFYTAEINKYLIPIKLNKIKDFDFKYMQQDVSIIPFEKNTNFVALIITDQTNIIKTNTILKSNILKINNLNNELLKEKKIIDNKVFFIKFNKENIITDISQAYLNLIKYKKDELLDNNFFFFERLHISKKLKLRILNHLKNEKVFKFESKTLDKEGKELWMQNTIIPDYTVCGKHIGFILFRDDITDTKKLYNQQTQLLSTSRNAAMGEMISMIAHQWRQPLSLLNTIIASLKIKQELNILNKENMYNSFEKMENTVNYLSDTIDDFRNFIKPNKTLSKITLIRIFEKSTLFLKEEIKKLDINYTQNIDEDLIISTYENELIQSIINILNNSIDAFKSNTQNNKNREISIKTKKELTHLSIIIKDNAGGIDYKIIKRVFEPYFSTKSKNGTGLGLYMCKTIIEDHLKGNITIKSKNINTAIIIELPYNLQNKSVYNVI